MLQAQNYEGWPSSQRRTRQRNVKRIHEYGDDFLVVVVSPCPEDQHEAGANGWPVRREVSFEFGPPDDVEDLEGFTRAVRVVGGER